MVNVELITGFKNLIVYFASRQLNLKLDPSIFTLKKVPWSSDRFILALEIYNDKKIPLRFRVYITGFGGYDLSPFRVYEDPNLPTGPEDELYVSETNIDRETYFAIMQYYSDLIEPHEYFYYPLILTEDSEPITTEDEFHLIYE